MNYFKEVKEFVRVSSRSSRSKIDNRDTVRLFFSAENPFLKFCSRAILEILFAERYPEAILDNRKRQVARNF